MTNERKKLLKEVLETLKNQALILEEISSEEQDLLDEYKATRDDCTYCKESTTTDEDEMLQTIEELNSANGSVWDAVSLLRGL